MYDIYSNDQGTQFVSSQNPSIVRQITPPPMNYEEINNMPITEKIPSEKHCSAN